jgi:nicotinamidase-related amidase
LKPASDDLVVHKTSCDAFLHTSLEDVLKQNGVSRVIVTGCATDFCVDTTVRSALARGYPTTVPADGHTTSDRPYLPAHKIIEHHNFVWSDFISPAGPATVIPCGHRAVRVAARPGTD